MMLLKEGYIKIQMYETWNLSSPGLFSLSQTQWQQCAYPKSWIMDLVSQNEIQETAKRGLILLNSPH